MNVDEKGSAKAQYKGKSYYFCSPTCQWAFDRDPERFVGKNPKS